MNIIKTALEGVCIIEPRVFKDDRGYFFESFSQKNFEKTVKWYLYNQEWMDNITSGDYEKYYDEMYKINN